MFNKHRPISPVAIPGLFIGREPTIEEKILAGIFQVFRVTLTQMNSKNQYDTIFEAKHMYLFLLRKFTNWTYKTVGERVNRDHATAIHSCRTAMNWIETDPTYAKKYKQVLTYIGKEDHEHFKECLNGTVGDAKVAFNWEEDEFFIEGRENKAEENNFTEEYQNMCIHKKLNLK